MNDVPVIAPDERTLHGWFDPALPPVLTVDAGTTVRFGTLDSGWGTGPWTGEDRPPERPLHSAHVAGAGHALTGPVAITGARAGMVLEVGIGAVVPGSYGFTVAGARPTAWNARVGVSEPAVLDWDISWDDAAGTGSARNQFGHTVALRPFMGVLGMPPAEPGRHSTIPPRWHGGNLDCKELVAGSTLYLPIPVDAALFSTGDGHAAQGDGEVGGTAIECPMTRVDLTFGLADDFSGRPLTTPVAHTPAGWVCMGVGDDLDEAAAEAMSAMLDLLGARFGLGRSEAMALAAVVVDLRVTQVANQVFGVHAVLPHDAVGS
jgi:acetamidase/formamidase